MPLPFPEAASLPEVGVRCTPTTADGSLSFDEDPKGSLEWYTAGGAVVWVAGVAPREDLMSPDSGAESNLGTGTMALSSGGLMLAGESLLTAETV